MRPDKFGENAPGTLVRIAEGLAFIPSPLTPELQLSRGNLVALDRAGTALGDFVGQARQVQNPDLIMAPLRRQEAILSSRIEGTRTEIRDVLLAEATAPDRLDENSDTFEVLNYLRALQYGQEWIQEGRPFNVTLVRGLHAELMRGVRGQDKHPGAFRATQVYIGDRAEGIAAAHFVPPPPEQVSPLIDNLIDFVAGGRVYGNLIDCAILHYQFEAIHPFEDGNGRLGRLLIPLFLLAMGVLDRPLLYLSPYFEAHRDTYMRLLNRVSTRGDWAGWILFFLEAIRSQAEDSKARVRRILDLQARYKEAARAASKTALLAIDYIMEHPYVSIGQIEVATGTTAPTAKAAIDALVGLGVLAPLGRVRGRHLWIAEDLLEKVYGA